MIYDVITITCVHLLSKFTYQLIAYNSLLFLNHKKNRIVARYHQQSMTVCCYCSLLDQVWRSSRVCWHTITLMVIVLLIYLACYLLTYLLRTCNFYLYWPRSILSFFSEGQPPPPPYESNQPRTNFLHKLSSIEGIQGKNEKTLLICTQNTVSNTLN